MSKCTEFVNGAIVKDGVEIRIQSEDSKTPIELTNSNFEFYLQKLQGILATVKWPDQDLEVLEVSATKKKSALLCAIEKAAKPPKKSKSKKQPEMPQDSKVANPSNPVQSEVVVD